jgi:hypothetical protein
MSVDHPGCKNLVVLARRQVPDRELLRIIKRIRVPVHPEYAAIRISFGFPPGDIPAAPL